MNKEGGGGPTEKVKGDGRRRSCRTVTAPPSRLLAVASPTVQTEASTLPPATANTTENL